MIPLQEDHIDAHCGVSNKQIKAKKRQLERVRRQKINEKLEKLKVIVMRQLGNDVGFYPPMEKADILELAIRCLESKEQVEDKENTIHDRKPFELNTKEKFKLETTPIRTNCSKAKKHELAENCYDENSMIFRQLPAEFKPLLHHPIRSFNRDNKHQTNQLQIRTLKHPIWRPWT
ncbi:uncharacterized protein LOC114537590 [Dendronephthya gigantea]|uniref:uncharacterized protein LOC114537590 n=1 Tax=Dendronephthya gigantea TaxID=151771 RepID=UPI00106BFE38|nr:uncharacterized protein LOC114537590 [Dendronephthya gigantea]